MHTPHVKPNGMTQPYIHTYVLGRQDWRDCNVCKNPSLAQGSPCSATQCSMGTYCSQAMVNVEGSGCATCPAGTFCNSCGMYAFQICPAGTYSASGSSTCQDCVAGTYTPIPQSTACTACPVGKYASTAGSTTCSLCLPGTYTPKEGTVACSFCKVGFQS
jgi:hypothetical protein